MIRSPATVTPLLHWLSTKHKLIELANDAFFCKRIEEHKQERVNSQSEIVNEYEVKKKMGFKL